MNPPTINHTPQTVPIFEPSLIFDSKANTDTNYILRNKQLIAPVIKEDNTAHYAIILAHEIRNPLANINLSVEMLKSELSDIDQKLYLEIINRSSERINILINQLLQYQHLEEVPTGKYSIHKLLDDVLIRADDSLILKDITVTKNYSPGDCEIVMNSAKMEIALSNIIINAIDAMASESGELTLLTKSIGGKFIIQIQDNGCGIKDKDLKHIFKPYFTNKSVGLGLGLATTYDILKSNQVAVNVESQEGKGTTFILTFDKTVITLS